MRYLSAIIFLVSIISFTYCEEQGEGERCEVDGDCASNYYCDKAPNSSSGHCCPNGKRWGDSNNDGVDDACITIIPVDGGAKDTTNEIEDGGSLDLNQETEIEDTDKEV